MILCLADSQPTCISIPAAPVMVRVFLHGLLSHQIGTLEGYLKLVIIVILHQLGDVNPLRDEHVLRLQDLLAIEDHRGIGIQAIEC